MGGITASRRSLDVDFFGHADAKALFNGITSLRDGGIIPFDPALRPFDSRVRIEPETIQVLLREGRAAARDKQSREGEKCQSSLHDSVL